MLRKKVGTTLLWAWGLARILNLVLGPFWLQISPIHISNSNTHSVPERLPCTINIHSLIHFCIKSFIPSLQTQTSYAPPSNTTDSRNYLEFLHRLSEDTLSSACNAYMQPYLGIRPNLLTQTSQTPQHATLWFHSRGHSEPLCKFAHPIPMFLNT